MNPLTSQSAPLPLPLLGEKPDHFIAPLPSPRGLVAQREVRRHVLHGRLRIEPILRVASIGWHGGDLFTLRIFGLN